MRVYDNNRKKKPIGQQCILSHFFHVVSLPHSHSEWMPCAASIYFLMSFRDAASCDSSESLAAFVGALGIKWLMVHTEPRMAQGTHGTFLTSFHNARSKMKGQLWACCWLAELLNTRPIKFHSSHAACYQCKRPGGPGASTQSTSLAQFSDSVDKYLILENSEKM